jgi:hypothetical protein
MERLPVASGQYSSGRVAKELRREANFVARCRRLLLDRAGGETLDDPAFEEDAD